MTATEILINGFSAIECEKKAIEKVGERALTDADIEDRLVRVSEGIKEHTGMIFDLPEVRKLYKSYIGAN